MTLNGKALSGSEESPSTKDLDHTKVRIDIHNVLNARTGCANFNCVGEFYVPPPVKYYRRLRYGFLVTSCLALYILIIFFVHMLNNHFLVGPKHYLNIVLMIYFFDLIDEIDSTRQGII